MKGERPVKIRLMRDQLRINCEESSPDVLRLSVSEALCANCVARLVPFACRPCSARGGWPVFLPSFLPAAIQPDTPFVHKDDDDRRSVRRFTRNSLPLSLRIWQSMSFLASPALYLSVSCCRTTLMAVSLSLSIRRDPSVHR